MLRIGDEAPDFTADTTRGTIRFHQWNRQSVGDPVLADCRILGLSVDPVASHTAWLGEIEVQPGQRSAADNATVRDIPPGGRR
jgi:alkyl hydroperoxide reductase subunit AhpC